MKPLSFKRHRFPPDVIRHALWRSFRFSLSLRDLERLLAERGVEVSYETIRCWTKPRFAETASANVGCMGGNDGADSLTIKSLHIGAYRLETGIE